MKKFKEIKNNLVPAKGVYVDPGQLGQYSATNQVAESALEDYLSSRGINHEHLSTPAKIAHSKSLQFIKWKQDHLARREEHSWQDKIDNARVADTVGRTQIIRDTLFGEATEKKSGPKANKPTALEKFRALAQAREKKHSAYEKDQGRDGAGSSDAIDRLEKHLNKEEIDINENHIAIAMGKTLDDESGMVLSQLEQLERCIGMIRSYVGKDYEKQLPAWVQSKITLATDYIDTVGNYLVSKNEKVSEEVEQIDELKKTTVFSWLKKQPVVPEKKPGMSRKDHNQKIKTHNKSWNRALDRLSGYKPTSEDVGDPKAAVNADGLNNPVLEPCDVPPLKKQMSKSARIIKALYKSKGMMKEDLYDHEKEDKSVASYGKKPKFMKTDEKDSKGENKPEAAAIMTGGKTLTGVERDDIEIDPMMRNRPGQPDITQKDSKKEDKKKDK